MKSIEVVVMIVIGGIGSITGAVFGAGILTVLPEALRSVDQQFPGLRMVLYALLLILFMIFRPQGLFGRREIGWAWLRLPNRTKIPVALSDAADARQHTGRRPVDRRSTLGGSDTDD
jgi:branched-chain amino acid transport system permease protein